MVDMDRIERPPTRTAPMDARVICAIRVLQRLTSAHISIGSLSRDVKLSPAHFRGLFKKETGKSPVKYLRELRFEKAESLLRNTFLSVKEIAFVCGMNDVSHFVRDFKTRYGLTPSEFRARPKSESKLPRELQ